MQERGRGEEKGLRIARAGFIQFLTQIITLGTGLVFVTLVTRNLSVSEFGIWQLVGSATGIALLPSLGITFWGLRGVARGEDLGKTTVIAAIMTVPLAFIIFLAVSTGVGSRVEILGVVVVAGLLQLPFITLYEGLKGTVQATRPTIMGYANIPFELAKVAVAYYLVVAMNIGLQGAILALVAAYGVQDIVMFYGVRDKLRGRLDLRKTLEWIKASWVPLLNSGVSRLWAADAIVVALVIGSAEPIGLFQGARVFTAIIAYSEIFLRVLYPKLIRDRLGTDVGVAFRLQTLLGVPMAVGAFVLAEDLLSVLGQNYLGSAPILRLLAIVTLVESTEHVMYFVLYGAERADSGARGLSFKSLRSSWFVKLPLLDFTKSALYLSLLGLLLYFLATPAAPQSVALIWGIAYGITVIPYTILKAYYAKKFFPHNLPLREITIYLLSGIVMGISLFFIRGPPPDQGSTAIQSILRMGYLVGLGALVYFAIVFVLDPTFRNMIKQVGRIRSSAQAS